MGLSYSTELAILNHLEMKSYGCGFSGCSGALPLPVGTLFCPSFSFYYHDSPGACALGPPWPPSREWRFLSFPPQPGFCFPRCAQRRLLSLLGGRALWSGFLALGEGSHHRGYLGREDLFCTVLLCILATSS